MVSSYIMPGIAAKPDYLFDLLNVVSNHMDASIKELRSKNKTARVKDARQVYCALARRLFPENNLTKLGAVVLRHPSTVTASIKKIREISNLRDERSRKITQIFNEILKSYDYSDKAS